MNSGKERVDRAVPFVLAMLLVTLLPLQSAQAQLGRRADEPPAGAPIAQGQEIEAYRGVPYTGTLTAVDKEGEAVTFALFGAPKKGTLELSEEGTFVYTSAKNKAGSDSFTFTATDESGNTSAAAEVKIRITRTQSGVDYADMKEHAAATAAMALAERGVFTGAKLGEKYFFEPERTLTRGEFTAMCLAAAGIEPSDVTVTGFSDDEALSVWARGVAAGALKAGVVRGVTTAEGVAFRADDPVTLGEAATVLNRLLAVTDVDMSDFYGSAQSAWSAQAVANLESVSILPSGSFGSSNLTRPLTRAEAAELLSAAMTLIDRRAESTGFFKGWF